MCNYKETKGIPLCTNNEWSWRWTIGEKEKVKTEFKIYG